MSDYLDYGTGVALIKGLSKAFITAEADAAQTAAQSAARAEAAAAQVESPVSYGVSQSLTDAQKTQARSNIGAMAADAMEMATAAETMTYVTGG